MIAVERPLRFLLFLIACALLLFAVIVSILWYVFGLATVERSGELEIPTGSNAGEVWESAVGSGFTSSTLPWRLNAYFTSDADIKAGTYQIEAGEKVADIIDRFITGQADSDEILVTFPEGFTLAQMAARVAARGIATEDEFIQAASPALFDQAQLPFLGSLPPGRDLEGYLFPDTYHFFKDDEPADAIRRMLANFNQKVTADIITAAQQQGRTLDEVIIMASIVEREVISDEDMALVAGVLWQRFNDGAGLGADATVRYALDKWDGPLTVQDLAVDSPYNTRRYAGLPPGPISNPGMRAITAAARPEYTDYYYYLSAPRGETIFSRTLDEHNQNKARYLR